MKRATITFPDALEQKLEIYLAQQRTPPSLSTVVQVALDEYLENQKWIGLEATPATAPLELPVSHAEVEHDVSADHDQYLAEFTSEKNMDVDARHGKTQNADTGRRENVRD